MTPFPAISRTISPDLIAKVVLNVSGTANVELDLEVVAAKCGLTLLQLREVLDSEEFAVQHGQHETHLMRMALTRGMKQMDAIVNNPKVNDNTRVAAYGAIVRCFAAARQQPQPKKRDEEQDDLVAALEAARKQNGSAR